MFNGSAPRMGAFEVHLKPGDHTAHSARAPHGLEPASDLSYLGWVQALKDLWSMPNGNKVLLTKTNPRNAPLEYDR